MNRRNFVRSLCATTPLLASAPAALSSFFVGQPAAPFRMKFSPEFGIFEGAAGSDPLDQISWAYDQGFRAWENTMLKNKPVALQENISRRLQELGMEFGQFVGTLTFSGVTFAGRDAAAREQVLKEVHASVEIARRMNTRFVHNVLGMGDPRLSMDFQMAHAIELLKRVAEVYEAHDLVMVMEPMNHKIDHPGMFLRTVPQAYALAKAVGSPSVKILFDIYHVQIEEGNLIPTLNHAWDEIAYFQIGDTPGRMEPTTGEINYPHVLQHIHDKGYRGFVGMEHGTRLPGQTGAEAVLAAYRTIDPR